MDTHFESIDRPAAHIAIAIDPSVNELRPSRSELAWLKKCARESHAQIQVVYISSGSGTISSSQFAEYVTHLHLGKNVVGTVVREASSSRERATHALLRFVKRQQINLVAVSSHGRSGMGRLVLGSFAESLLATSPVPMLFLSDGGEGAKKSNKILFPTDFSEPSKKTLRLLLKSLQRFKGEVIIYNAISIPGSILETGVTGVPIYIPENYWSDQRNWALNQIEELSKEVRDHGLVCRSVIQDNVINISSAIKKFASDEKVSMIGMASAKSNFESSVLGSVAKGVFRQRKWPVWVCGPETKYGDTTA
ncbi:MAG: universal stress protein [Bdellovibrionales bacterium]|nr:universal stress protein [Oligoflexia bacterium]